MRFLRKLIFFFNTGTKNGIGLEGGGGIRLEGSNSKLTQE